MGSVDMPDGGTRSAGHEPRDEPGIHLRLYVARSTPNSVRAEHNLAEVLSSLAGDVVRPLLEIIDVFSQPRRAFTDGVMVTPTLIAFGSCKRIVLLGDLADTDQLKRLLEDLAA